jgi:hypothetical protein
MAADPGMATAAGVWAGGAAAGPSSSPSEDDRPADPLHHPRRDAAGEQLALLALEALQLAYRAGDDWNDMFDRLTADELDRLKDLFPYMPPLAARHFAERFIIPRT